jgi:hypothetical protein
MTALEFLARWVDHVPERYEVRVRDAGAYATRRRVWWRRRGIVLAHARAPSEVVEPEASGPALQARRRRWAELLRLVFKVDVEVCPRCGGEARILGFVTEPRVVRRILAHLERRGVDARAGPWRAAEGEPAWARLAVGPARAGSAGRWVSGVAEALPQVAVKESSAVPRAGWGSGVGIRCGAGRRDGCRVGSKRMRVLTLKRMRVLTL